MRKIESIVKVGCGDNLHFRDFKGRRVEVEFLARNYYRREDVSAPWGEINERIPVGADASYTEKIEKTTAGVYYYTIVYVKILSRD